MNFNVETGLDMGVIQPYPITSYSLCNSLGQSVEEVVSAIAEGKSGLRTPEFELPFVTTCGAVSGHLPRLPEKIAHYDTRILRMVCVAFEGIAQDVARAVKKWGSHRVGVIMGTSTGGIEQSEEAYQFFKKTGRIPESYNFDFHHPFHLSSDAIAELAGITGPRYVVSTACSSGGKTLAAARRLLNSGVVDAVVTGGVDGLCQTTLRGFHSLSILSPEPCQPFSSDRKGISIGEGAALILIERSGEAQTALLGVGESSDAFHMSSPDPEGKGAKAAMSRALEQGGITPSQIDHINTHGTGTQRNDAAESKAMFDMFGDSLPVASTKGYTGHLLGAGGSTEAIFGIVAIEQGWIPASKGSDPLDEEIKVNVSLAKQARKCRAILSNSFGFGGSNVSVLLGATP